MRNAKQYIIDNNLDFKIANDILAEWFLRNYKTVVL
jgi:DNA replication protein DnaD